MMIALVLLAAASTMAVQLFRPTMRVIRETPAAHDDLTRRCAALERLRADAWSMSDISVETSHRAITVHTSGQPDIPGRRDIRWRIEDGRVIRSGDGEEMTWPGISAGMTFAACDRRLIVRWDHANSDIPESYTMASQVDVVNGGAR